MYKTRLSSIKKSIFTIFFRQSNFRSRIITGLCLLAIVAGLSGNVLAQGKSASLLEYLQIGWSSIVATISGNEPTQTAVADSSVSDNQKKVGRRSVTAVDDNSIPEDIKIDTAEVAKESDKPLSMANVTVNSIAADSATPSASDNDYTRINNAILAASSGDTITLNGVFDWTETNAAASWALGSDGLTGTPATANDDYTILAPLNLNNITLTATSLGTAQIKGPGDLAAVNLEGVLQFYAGGTNQNWTISNLHFEDFDNPIGFYLGTGTPVTAYSGTKIQNNYILLPIDLNATVAPGDVNQNIGIHFSFGVNQEISGNTIEVRGNGVSDTGAGNFSSEVGIQSNTSGGSVYNGLQITNNTVRVLNAQNNANPQVVIGIWENSHGHLSNITVSGNKFLNVAGGNNPAVNLQRGFRVTSHSSVSTTVEYLNNSVEGANLGFQWLSTSGANQPVKLTSNNISNNATGLFLNSNGSADLKFNRIANNSVTGINNGTTPGILVFAEDNWWGCNSGPGAGGAGCAGTANGFTGAVTASTWLVLKTSVSPTSKKFGGTPLAITADLTTNSANNTVGGNVPDTTPITFGETGGLGTVSPTSSTLTSGVAASTFTALNSAGVGTATATIDGQTVGANVNVDPVVTSINRKMPLTQYTNNDPVVFEVIFNAPVKNVDDTDFVVTALSGAVSGATVSSVNSVSPFTTYAVTVTATTGEGEFRLDLIDDDSIQTRTTNLPLGGTGAGNGNFTTGETYIVDVFAPTVTINQNPAQADSTTASPIVFDVLFSEPVQNFATGDVVLSGTSGATTATVSGSGAAYTVTVTGMTSSGTVIVNIPANAAQDLSGKNNSAATTGLTINDDNVVNYFIGGIVLAVDLDGQATAADCNATVSTYNSIQSAINAAGAGYTVKVCPATYIEDVVVNKPNLILEGSETSNTIISGAIGGSGATLQIAENNVEVKNFNITREGNTVAQWNLALNSAGVAVQGTTITGLNLHDNLITGNRSGIDINNSNGHTIRNNDISNNRTGIIFRNQTDNLTVVENNISDNWTVGILFLDASGGTNVPVQTAANCNFSNNNLGGNWYGQIVDRQNGGALPAPGNNLKNFSGNWFGTTTPVISTANSAEPGYAAQIPVIYGGTATAPGGQPDILGSASANFDYSPFLYSGTDTNVETTSGRGTFGFQGDFSNLNVTAASPQASGTTGKIKDGINFVTSGGTVNVLAGTYTENVTIDKPVNLLGPNASIDPNSSTPRVAEAIVHSAASDSDPYDYSDADDSTIFILDAEGITLKGFTIDGDTPALNSGFVVNGADIDSYMAVDGLSTTNPNADLSFNIVKNFGEFGLVLSGTSDAGVRTNSTITRNKIDNVIGWGYGEAIRIGENAFANVTENVVTRSFNGVTIENFNGNADNPNPRPNSLISNNNITAYGYAIWFNLHYSYAVNGFSVTNNTVSSYVESGPAPFAGKAPSKQSPTENPEKTKRILRRNSNENAANGTGPFWDRFIGIRVESIQQTVPVTFTRNRILPDGAGLTSAGYTIVDGMRITNPSTATPNLSVTENLIANAKRGIAHTAANAIPNVSCNNFFGNEVGIYVGDGTDYNGDLESATSGILANNNNIVGNTTFGVEVAASIPVNVTNAENNYWGAANGPGPIGPGSGDKVTAKVDFTPFLSAPATGCTTTTPAFPTVTIDRASGQSDPTSSSPINFTVTFSENVAGFDSSDVIFSGAGATTATVTPITGSIYNVAISGMNTTGTVTASVIPGAAISLSTTNPSLASNSTDNSVDYIQTTVTNLDTTETFTTIQAAVNDTDTLNGHTLQASAGFYNEYVNVTKSLTIQGAQFGNDARSGRTNLAAESTVGIADGAFRIQSSVTVTIDGFRLTGADDGAGTQNDRPALLLDGGTGHQIINNIIEGNQRAAYFSSPNTKFYHNRVNNSLDGFFGGVDNTTVEENLFTGGHPSGAVNTTRSSADPVIDNFRIINNSSLGSGNFAVVFATSGALISGNTIANATGSAMFIGGGNTNLTIENNTMTGIQFAAFNVNDAGFGYGNNSNITINGNTITRSITAAANLFSTIDLRGVAGNNRITNNTVTLGLASGAPIGTSGYAVRLRGSGSGSFTITGNYFDGSGLIATPVTNSPPTAGIYLTSNVSGAGTNFGQLPATAVVNAGCNTFVGFQEGVSVFDNINNTNGGLLTGTDVNFNSNNFLGNTVFGINNGGTSETINAENNYWNSASGPSGTGPGTGDAVTANVDFDPFLTAASNCAPINNVPPAQTVDQDTVLTFSSGNGNQISVSDVDATTATVTVSVTNGTFSLSQITGLAFTVGDGTENLTMTFSGTLADINSALNGLVFTPTPAYVGGAVLTIETTTQGSIGIGGGTQTDTDTVAITVRDAIAPTVTANPSSGQTSPTNNPSISFSVDFNETVSGFNPTLASDFTVTNGAVASFTDNGDTTYTIIVTAAADGAVTAFVPAGAAQDGGGNGNTVSNTATVTYDGTAPVITINQANLQTDPTSTSPINFTVSFSEAVTGFALSDLSVSGTAGATTAVLSGSGLTYNVAVSGMTQTGTVILNVANGAVTDTAGNNSGVALITDNEVQFNLVNTDVIVSSADMLGWGFLTETPNGTGSFVTGPATPPMGTGSARLTVDATGGQIIGKLAYGGTRLDQITQLTYSTYQNNNTNTAAAIAFQFNLDEDLTDANTAFQGRLVYEPTYDTSVTVQQGVWQNWNVLSPTAKFWASPNANSTIDTACPQGNPCTLAQVLAAYPNLGIHASPTLGAVIFKVGGGIGSAFDGNVDKFTIGVNSANTTFDFEDRPPTVSIGDVSVTEGGSAVFDITLSEASDLPVTVNVSTADDTATTAANDYVAVVNQTVTIPANTLSATVSVNTTTDTTDEPDETFFVNLSNSVNAGILDGQGVGTIQDDDNAPAISIVKDNPATVTEGNSGTQTSTFTVSLSNPSSSTITVDVAAGGTATSPSDFTLDVTSLTFNPLETTKTVTATIIGDTLVEPDETFAATLSNPTSATLDVSTASGTIVNDDAFGELVFDSATYSVTEGTPTVTITVNRINGSAQPVSVSYATANGTAIAGFDYTATNGTLSWSDGDTAPKTFTVAITDDLFSELPETVNLTLSNPLGGAILGAQFSSLLTINDNDGGGLVTLSGNIKQYNFPSANTNLANVTVNLTGSATATTVTDVDGNYTFTGLPANGSFLVTPSTSVGAGVGKVFDPISRNYASLNVNVSDGNFIAYNAGNSPRIVRIGLSNTVPGTSVTVPVELVSLGNENGVSFSFTYNQALLSSPVVALGDDAAGATIIPNTSTAGVVGVVLALPSSQTFTAGTKQIVKVTFNTSPTAANNTPLNFTNSPVVSKVSDAGANPLPTQFANGFVVFAQGLEADVDSRPNGDNDVDVGDFILIGQFAAALATPDFASSNEFQRADNEPTATKGNGTVDLGDFIQAGRYAAVLDPLQSVGGPAYPIAPPPFAGKSKAKVDGLSVPREVRVVNATAQAGTQVVVSLAIDAEAGDKGVSFTMDYDSTKLSNPQVLLGTGANGAFLIPNTTINGKVIVQLAYIAGGFPSGLGELVTVRFDVAPTATPGITPLTFNDNPVQRQVRDTGNVLVASNFVDGGVNIINATASNVSVGGRVVASDGQTIPNARVILTGSNGASRTVTTNSYGNFRFEDVAVGQNYVVAVNSKGYRFAPRTVSILEGISDLTLTAEP